MPVYVSGLFLHAAGEYCKTIGDYQHCFSTNRESKAWDEARTHCDSVFDKSYSLVAIDDPQVQKTLEKFMNLNDMVGKFVWIGLTQTTEGQWSWVDSTLYTGDIAGQRFLFLFITN